MDTRDGAPSSASRTGRSAALLAWLGIAGFLAWAITYFLEQLDAAARRPLSLAGIAVAVVVLGAWLLHSSRLLRGRRGRVRLAQRPSPITHDGPMRRSGEDDPSAKGSETQRNFEPVPAADAAALVRRAVGLLDAARRTAPLAEGPVPEVVLARAGRGGVELLLAEPVEVPPACFERADDGWSLRPLPESLTASDPVSDGEGAHGAGELVELGWDDDGIYFAPGSTTVVTADRLGEAPDGDDPMLVVMHEPPGIVVEPYGLRLLPPGAPEALDEQDDERDAPCVSADGDDGADATDEPVHEAPATEVLEDLGDEGFCDELPEDLPREQPVEVANDDSVLSMLAPPAPTEAHEDEPLVPLGPVEARILRDEPDLVGALCDTPTPPAVEFVAFLATHGHRATTQKLRDALGTARAHTSRSGRTVWNAAGFARRCLGETYVPAATGNQLYVLSRAVTTDWGRFVKLSELAKAASDPTLARRALCEALELVEGVPAAGSPRYLWLDTEHLLEEITDAVLDAACRLAEAELERFASAGSREAVAWAIAKGRLVAPRSPELEALEARLSTS